MSLLLTGCSMSVWQSTMSGSVFVILLSLLGAGCRQGVSDESQLMTFLRYTAAAFGINTSSREEPEIQVFIDEDEVKSGDTHTIRLDDPDAEEITRSVRINNKGSDYLVIRGVSIDGENSDQFDADLESNISISPGESLEFDLTLKLNGEDEYTADVTIKNNDENEEYFSFTLLATTYSLRVTVNGEEVAPGDVGYAFGRIKKGDTDGPVTLTIENRGDDNVTISSIESNGDTYSEFDYSSPGETTIGPDGSIDLEVSFAPQLTAPNKSFEMVINSDADDIPAYSVRFSGNNVCTTARDWGTDLDLSSDLVANGEGFKIFGTDYYGFAGRSVAMGDVNGDGLDDIVMGMPGWGQNGMSPGYTYLGQVIVIYGKKEGFTNIDPRSGLNPDDGFFIGRNLSPASGWEFGQSVGIAGDVNHDGKEDILIGENDGTNSYVYLVFGRDDYPSYIDTTVADTNTVIKIFNGSTFDVLASPGTLAGTGDINGDGVDDFAIGASGASYSGIDSGAVWIIYGKGDGESWVNTSYDLQSAELTSGKGFRIEGINSADYFGDSVDGAGDVNGDKINDIIVGARGVDHSALTDAGSAYIILGKDDPGKTRGSFNVSVGTSELVYEMAYDSGTINVKAGVSVAGIGDVNDDGFDDVLIGSDYNNNHTYLVFGSNAMTNLNLASDLDGSNGIALLGSYQSEAYKPGTTHALGDLNGDMIDDFILADPVNPTSQGSGYFIFGRDLNTSWDSTTVLSSSIGGIFLGYNDAYLVPIAAGTSVFGGGDINGDGCDDIVIGAPQTTYDSSYTKEGAVFVIFGALK